MFYCFEEFSDVASEAEVRQMMDAVLDAFQSPFKDRLEKECIVGETAKQCVSVLECVGSRS
jgi:hypothetical protein